MERRYGKSRFLREGVIDNFLTLTNRLLSRAPAIGPVLAGQLVNDSWRTLQARKDWAWRRKSGVFAPPTSYNAGQVSTNVATGNANLITGVGTTWDGTMVGRQIRCGGLLYPYYSIIAVLSPTQILIDSPWAGPDIAGQAYQIVQVYYAVPDDFGYFDLVVSIKDSYKLWTQATQAELGLWDPQRSTQGQTYCVAYKDDSPNFGGIIGPCFGITSPTDPAPVSTTTTGYNFPGNNSYIVQIVSGGISGVATWQWLRSGQLAFQGPFTSSDTPQDLSDGVQIYFPDVVSYVTGDLFVINAQALVTSGVPRYELWPVPTFNGYLYPYQYFSKEMDLTAQNPTLPPQVANRGEMLLEMALEKAALFPGQDLDHPNPYYSLQLARYHQERYENMLIDFENNDQNISISNLEYESWPYGGSGVWNTGRWQQGHAPLLQG